jgi:mannose-6-phosphate isomerase-like protein (cupin superfamily)
MLRKQIEMEREAIENCHEGSGLLDCTTVLTKGDSELGIQFMHDDLLEPGATIGEHLHGDSEEVYFVVEGRGTLIMDGEESPVGPGDVSVVSPGHSHGLINNPDLPMRLIVIGLKRPDSERRS